MSGRKISLVTFQFALLFTLAPIATYFIFAPSESPEDLARRLRWERAAEVNRQKQGREAVVRLILDQKDEAKNKVLADLIHKGMS
jgi:hypothetical protein